MKKTLMQAKDIANKTLDELASKVGDVLILLEEETIERPLVFAFFYQTREYVNTGDSSTMLAGNSPILVNRISGQVKHSGTALPVEHYITEMESEIFSTPHQISS